MKTKSKSKQDKFFFRITQMGPFGGRDGPDPITVLARDFSICFDFVVVKS